MNLLCNLFAEIDTGIGHRAGEILQVLFLGLDKPVDTIEGNTSVVSDDTASGIVVRKSGDESQLSETQNLISIYIENSVIMGLSVMSEDFLYFRVQFHAILMACFLHNSPSSERLDGTLQEFICLESDNEFILLVNIPCGV